MDCFPNGGTGPRDDPNSRQTMLGDLAEALSASSAVAGGHSGRI
jgi:hypothetical protein